MKIKTVIGMVMVSAVMASSATFADHNSPMGAGTANMPNDIHNTRIEDDNETFLSLVQGGGGADSVNRYDDSDTTSTMGRSALDTRGRMSFSSMSSSRMGSMGGSSMGRGGRR